MEVWALAVVGQRLRIDSERHRVLVLPFRLYLILLPSPYHLIQGELGLGQMRVHQAGKRPSAAVVEYPQHLVGETQNY